jgi:hypothetical protein
VIAANAGVGAPRVRLELRDDGGLVLGAAVQDTEALGWSAGDGERELRLELDRLPLAEGRFHLRFGLIDAVTGRPLHTLDDAVRFFVFPAGGQTGPVLLDGAWSMQEIAPVAPIPRP